MRYYGRLLLAYARETRSPVQFTRLLRIRLALSRGIGKWVCPTQVSRTVVVRSLGGPVVLRSHTTDISVHDELIVSHGYAHLLGTTAAPSTIVDLGANIGLATRWLAHAFPSARILAVEPEPGNAQVLLLNAAPCSNRVQVRQVAVADKRGTALISTSSGEHGFSIVGSVAGSGSVEVPVVTMQDLLDDAGFEIVDILKCDIEGAERLVFADCSPWIDRVRVLEIECHAPYGVDDLVADLLRNGARFDVLEHTRNPAFACEVALLRNARHER